MGLVRKFYSVDRMVRPENLRGELPATKEAYKRLSSIAIPSVIEMVFMSLIGSVDVIMVSVLGYEAIAAVGLAGQPRMLMLSLVFALNIGVTAIIARRKGQNLPDEANRTLRNALVLITGLVFVITIASVALSKQLMLLAGAQEDTFEMATTYFRILSCFFPVNALTMCINAAQRGTGNTRITMYANLTANVVNLFFNYLLIGGNFGFPALGVAGAAYATGIGACVGLVLSLMALFGRKHHDQFLRISLHDDWRLHPETLRSIVKVGGNAMIEQVLVRIGFFFYSAIVASLGTVAFAAHQVGIQFLTLSFTFGDGIAVAGTALVGQMLGKERPDVATIYGKCSQRLALTVSVFLATTIAFSRHFLVSIFLNPADPANLASYQLACTILLMVALFQVPQMSSVVLSGCLRGSGDNLFVAVAMMICVVGVRPTLSLFAVHVLHMGLVGAWSASLIDMSLRLTLVFRRFSGGKWHNKKV